MTTPLSYLDSFEVGGECVCKGNLVAETLAVLVSPPVFLPPVSLSFGKLAVGPVRDLELSTRFPAPTVERQNRILFQELRLVSSVCATNVVLHLVAKELH